jgi:GxxExxY protein
MELIYGDLSYKINGLLYQIDNQIGFGHVEKIYADAFEQLLKDANISYEREYYIPLKVNDKVIARKYVDFLIDGKIIVELKTGDYMYREVCSQIFSYLKSGGFQLGIVGRFTKNGVMIKRILNIRDL